MRTKTLAMAVTVSLIAVNLAWAGSNRAEVVTNGAPAVSATMTLSTDANGCATWIVEGKVKPAYRGHGATVRLVCMSYDQLASCGTTRVFPAAAECDGDFCPGDSNVDGCGNFSFQIFPGCGAPSQLDPSNLCMFVVHVDDSKSPQSCANSHANTAGAVQDPNGSTPCSGGYCPSAP